MRDYRRLQIWERSHLFTLDMYRVPSIFPDSEKFGLVSQIRRSAVSIPANIAEGSVRSSDADFTRFLHISMGSAAELDYHLLLSRDLGFIETEAYTKLANELNEVRRMLTAFTQSLKTRS